MILYCTKLRNMNCISRHLSYSQFTISNAMKRLLHTPCCTMLNANQLEKIVYGLPLCYGNDYWVFPINNLLAWH